MENNMTVACVEPTPVTVLQELLSQEGTTPRYEQVQMEGALHEPTFRYRVTVADVVAMGTGRSKKEAKHAAAKALLDKINVGPGEEGSIPVGNSNTMTEVDSEEYLKHTENGGNTEFKVHEVSKNLVMESACKELTLNSLIAKNVSSKKRKYEESVTNDLMESLKLQKLELTIELMKKDCYLKRRNEIVAPYDDKIPGNPIGSLQEMCTSRRWPRPSYEMVSEEGLLHERLFTIACTVFKQRELGTGKSKKLAKRMAAHKMWEKLQDAPIASSNMPTGLEDDDENMTVACVEPTPVTVLQELLSQEGTTPRYEQVQMEGSHHEPTFRYRVTVADVVAMGTGRSKKEAKHAAAKALLDKINVGPGEEGSIPVGNSNTMREVAGRVLPDGRVGAAAGDGAQAGGGRSSPRTSTPTHTPTPQRTPPTPKAPINSQRVRCLQQPVRAVRVLR